MIENKNLFAELEQAPVSKKEALRYAGVRTEELLPLLSECEKELLPTLKCLVCYRIVDFCVEDDFLRIGPTRVKSKKLKEAFIGAEKVLIFVATVGRSPDRLVAKYERSSLVRAHMINSLAIERIESLCDSFSDKIKEDLLLEGYQTTRRFSPGYGDLDLEYQREIFALLSPPKYIGVTLSDSLLMTPTKSVSALIGIKKKLSQHNTVNAVCI